MFSSPNKCSEAPNAAWHISTLGAECMNKQKRSTEERKSHLTKHNRFCVWKLVCLGSCAHTTKQAFSETTWLQRLWNLKSGLAGGMTECTGMLYLLYILHVSEGSKEALLIFILFFSPSSAFNHKTLINLRLDFFPSSQCMMGPPGGMQCNLNFITKGYPHIAPDLRLSPHRVGCAVVKAAVSGSQRQSRF